MLQKNKRRAVDLPAKPKFTKAEIIDAAYEIALKGDLSLVTAREVGKALGTSSSPIFTVFENMEQLKAAVWQKALQSFIPVLQAPKPATFRIATSEWKRLKRRSNNPICSACCL